MLLIKKAIVNKKLTIGQFFSSLKIEKKENTEAKNNFDIKVKTPAGFKQIEAFYHTEKLLTKTVKLNSGKTLEGANNHRIMIKSIKNNSENEWVFLNDLKIKDKVVTASGYNSVESIIQNNSYDILYDIQVADVHCFYTNDILSHNSHALVMLGAEALKQGKTVLHYTFELSEMAVGIRYDSYLCGIASNDIPENQNFVKDFYENSNFKKLIIKEYPTGSATAMTIKGHIEKLRLRNIVPDILIIDYADIMRSTAHSELLRQELKLVYEQLRNMAMELQMPIWTASQSNRSGATMDIIGMENMSESYGKAMVADVILSLSRKPDEKATGAGRLFIAKNRAGRDGIVFNLNIDTSQSRFTVIDDHEQLLSDVRQNDENDIKERLREKWKALNGSKLAHELVLE